MYFNKPADGLHPQGYEITSDRLTNTTNSAQAPLTALSDKKYWNSWANMVNKTKDKKAAGFTFALMPMSRIAFKYQYMI